MGYQLNEQLVERMNRHEVDSLREEILLAKATLDMRLSACKTEAEQIAITPLVMSSLVQIDRLVTDHRKFEEQSHRTLRKLAIKILGEKIVEILVRHLKQFPGSDQIIAAIADDIAVAIDAVQNPVDKDDE